MANETIVLPIRSNTVSGSVSTSGLSIAGKITIVTLSSAVWTALPIAPLINRNHISIQNLSGVEMKINYTDSVGYIGIVVADGSERHVDITDDVIIFGRVVSGSPSVTVEEVS